jgi:hypothetical protein
MIRFKTLAAMVVAITLILSFAGSGLPAKVDSGKVYQTVMEKSPGKFGPAEYVRTQQQMFDFLMSEAAELSPESIINIHVSASELAEIENYSCESCAKSRQKMRVGIAKTVRTKVTFKSVNPASLTESARFESNGMMRATTDSGYVWTAAAESANATALRLHFTRFSLPEGAGLFIYGVNGEAFGPYTGRGPNRNGNFWSHTVTGPVVYMQIRHSGPVTKKKLKKTGFVIKDVAHLGRKFLLPFLQRPTEPLQQQIEALCSFNAPCIEDAKCYGSSTWSVINDARYAYAHMQFVSGMYIYICTGGLLNDTDTTTWIPYFLTANHCISTASEANSLECYWQFWTSSCGGACYDPVGAVPRTLGSDIMATGSTSDYTLLKLDESPPSGSTFLGWTSAAVANTNNFELYRISHPLGAPQAFSKHLVDTSKPTCSGWPRGAWIYSRDVIGATEGGSSGSPVCNDSGQVVGQLSGSCGYNVNDPCDSESNATVDGAFANYYSAVSSYLNPTTPVGDKMHVHSIVVSITNWWFIYIAKATVTIRDENNDPVSGATVYGTFSGDVSGSKNGTTNSSGVVTLSITKWGTISSFTFCVDNVTHSSYTYDSSANVETCDTY